MLDYYADVDLDRETLERAECEALERPSNSAMWDDRLYTSHVPVIAWAERGDDILAESNYLSVLERLRGVAVWDDRDAQDDPDGYVIDATISDWLVGSLRQVFVQTRDESGEFTHVFRESVSIALALRDYPVFDESDFSEREMIEHDRQMDDALRDARRDFDSQAYDLNEHADELTDEQDAAIREELWGDDRLEYDGPNVDYNAVGKVYAEHADRLVLNGWEAYARSLDNPNGEAQLTLA